jgi:hypothetical protein
LLVLALACCAAVLAGCGISKTIDPVAAAATKTEDAGGVKVHMTMQVTDPATGPVTITADGVTDDTQADMTMDFSQVPGASQAFAGDSSMEMRFLEEGGDPVLYMHVPFLASKLPGGQTWVRMDLEQAGKSMGIDFSQLMSGANENPGQTLDMLRASGDVTEVGTEDLDGVSTTHYTATIDLTKEADRLGSGGQAMVQRLIAMGAPSTIPVDVWVSDDGYVRRMTMDESMVQQGRATDMKLTLDMSDYGTTVNVTAPPSDETYDITDLASQAAQAAAPTTH